MSNSWLNIMFFGYHLHAGHNDSHWWKFTIKYNPYHKKLNWPDGKIKVYTLFNIIF